jgi:hypothetical protein
VLPKHPDLDQLKRQAKELLDAVRAGEPGAVSEAAARYPGAAPEKFALHDAQLVLARAYGFDSWPRLRAYLSGGMIKPPELDSDRGSDVWETITAAASGDTATLQRLIQRDRKLSRAEYFYAPPILFAVREGRADAVRMLLDAGAAETEWNAPDLDGLIEIARDRGFDEVATILDEARRRRGDTQRSPGSCGSLAPRVNPNPPLAGAFFPIYSLQIDDARRSGCRTLPPVADGPCGAALRGAESVLRGVP